MARLTLRRELAWAIGFLGLAVILGFMFHWPLVQASLRGSLTALLDQKRQERREVQFQGARTLDLAQAYQVWQEKQALFVDARKAAPFPSLWSNGPMPLFMHTCSSIGAPSTGCCHSSQLLMPFGLVNSLPALVPCQRLPITDPGMGPFSSCWPV